MSVERTWLTPGLTVALGLVGGALLGWATLLVSQTDIGGPGWSLRGNGALVVEFAGGPSLLAGGWVGLARGRLGPALVAAAITLAIELGVGFGPILAGPGTGLSARLLVGLWPPIVALLAGLGLAPPPTARALLLASGVCVLAIALSLGLPFLLFVVAPLLLPLVLATPTILRYAQRSVAASLVALPVALVAGTLGAQRLLT
jgi:hypothetical protein